MTVQSVLLQVVPVGREHKQLAPGVQPFVSNHAVTGDGTGGRAEIRWVFNIDNDVTFQPYVTITHCAFHTSTAALTGSAVLMAQGPQWEQAAVTDKIIVVLQSFQTLDALIFHGVSNDVVSIGRALRGVDAGLRMQFDNVDTTVYNGAVSGFITDFPYIPGDSWRY